ncbi:Nitrobenzene nitroreductase [Thauera humireducens]|uniref:nitroreductase n=1 Tax=Thauera humireducens TaxID=1134435 RepID=UPI002467AA7B|nr:nitroreductase [Thauera humireducens]CAH1748762.1 Nitrobenzene nitroreductase [Thauera humireducens]
MTNAFQPAVDEVIQSRYSCRAFLPRPVPRTTIEEILAVASRAPSGTNIQPWRAWVLTGETKAALSERLLAAFDDPEEAATHADPYQYYPKQWISPYIDRRRKVGLQLYGLLGIQKGDAKRMHEQFARNYKFFDAPVGLIFTVDRVMEQGSWLDYGMFLQNVMLAAKARGLDTCPQAALIQFHRIIRQTLEIPDNETLICGMSLGYADTAAPENTLRTERAPLSEWVSFRD